MNLGVYFTVIIGSIIGIVYNYFYGYKHPYFATAALLYSLGSILTSYAMRLNVDPQLDFNFNIMVVSEALGFTVNTFTQAILIRLLHVDPILSFGLAAFASGLVQAATFLIFLQRNPQYSAGVMLELFKDGDEKERYFAPNSLKFTASLAYNTLLNDFFDQTYFVIFAPNATFLGELTLIRGFGSLFVRFVFMPINNVTYNLYSKLYLESMKASSPQKSQTLVSKIIAIANMVIFLYSNLTYFLLAYGIPTSLVFLRIIFGQKWVNQVLEFANSRRLLTDFLYSSSSS